MLEHISPGVKWLKEQEEKKYVIKITHLPPKAKQQNIHNFLANRCKVPDLESAKLVLD